MSAIDLGDIDFAAGPLDRATALGDVLDATVGADEPALCIGSPSSVEREAKWRWPVLIAQTGSADALDRSLPEERGVLVLLCEPMGVAHVAGLMREGEAPRWPLAALDAKVDPHRAIRAARVARVDAAHRFALPHEETTARLFVVVADRVSNAADVVLSARRDAPDAFETNAGSLSRSQSAERAGARGELPPSVLHEGGATVPTEPGIVLRVERYAVRREGSTLLLRGAFRLPSHDTDVITLSLVATGASQPTPRAAHVRVPARADDGHVVGSFALDLWRTALCDPIDTWFVHAFALGHAAATPAILTVVAEAD